MNLLCLHSGLKQPWNTEFNLTNPARVEYDHGAFVLMNVIFPFWIVVCKCFYFFSCSSFVDGMSNRSSGASSGTSNVEQSDRDDSSELHFALMSPESPTGRKVAISHVSHSRDRPTSSEKLASLSNGVSDAALEMEVKRLYGMHFRAHRERFRFIPINEQVEGEKHTKIASSVALAAVEAGISSAYDRGRHNLPRAEHPQHDGTGSGTKKMSSAATKKKGSTTADSTSAAVERAMGAAAAMYGDAYTYEWQKPPIFKAVLEARIAELREHGISVTDGTAIEWNALIAALDVSVRATAAPRVAASSASNRSRQGKGPAVATERRWFWGWRKTPHPVGNSHVPPPPPAGDTQTVPSEHPGSSGSSVYLSGNSSVFSSRSSSQTSGPGSALLGSPASTQYNTPQSTPTSKGSTPAIAEVDEAHQGDRTASGPTSAPHATTGDGALQLRVRSWSGRGRMTSLRTPSLGSSPCSPVGEMLSMSLGAADLQQQRRRQPTGRPPSARQMVLDGWMDDDAASSPRTPQMGTRRPRRQLSQVGLSGPLPGTRHDLDEQERERERQHDAVVAAALSATVTPTPTRSASGSMSLGRPTALSVVTPTGHVALSRTSLARLRSENLTPTRTERDASGALRTEATRTANTPTGRPARHAGDHNTAAPTAKKTYPRSAFRTCGAVGGGGVGVRAPATLHSQMAAEELAVRGSLRRLHTALAAARTRMARMAHTARAYARLLLSTRIYHAYCALAHYRERLMLLASEATALAATSTRQGRPNPVVDGTRQILVLEIARMDRLACSIDTALRGAGAPAREAPGPKGAAAVACAPPTPGGARSDACERKTAMGAHNLVHPVPHAAAVPADGAAPTSILDLFLHMVTSEVQPASETDLLRRGQEVLCGNEHVFVDKTAKHCARILKRSRDIVASREKQLKTFKWAQMSDAKLKGAWSELTRAVRSGIAEVEANICTIDAECLAIQQRFPCCDFGDDPSTPLVSPQAPSAHASASAVWNVTSEYIKSFSHACWAVDDEHVTQWWDTRLRALVVDADRQRQAVPVADNDVTPPPGTASPPTETRAAQLLRAADPSALGDVTAAVAAHAQFATLVEAYRARVVGRWHVLVHDRPDGPLPSDVAHGVGEDIVFKRDLGVVYASSAPEPPQGATQPAAHAGVKCCTLHDAWAAAAAWAQAPPTSIVAHGAAILAATRQAAWISSGVRMQSELGSDSAAKQSLLAGTKLVGSRSEFVNWSKSFIGFAPTDGSDAPTSVAVPTLVEDIQYLAVDCAGVKDLVDDSTGATLALRASWQWEADHMLNR
eukprot:m.1082267 g.1082267  ORF g.1082267 m.1082267 type:complete len:1300 (+) comp24264_c0_seq1:58-3957(+)